MDNPIREIMKAFINHKYHHNQRMKPPSLSGHLPLCRMFS